ncbi:MAG: efflux RND transporter periplasmic adaptor subunit [Chitinophagales bacterium]
MKNVKKTIPYAAIVLVLIIGVVLYHYIGSRTGVNKQDAQKASANNITTVEVQKIKNTQLPQTSTYDATLNSSEDGVLGTTVPGKVVQIMFKEGEKVVKGTPLVQLDSQTIYDQLKVSQGQLAAVKAALPKAEASLKTMQRNYNNAKSLFEAGAVSQNDMDNAETAFKVAQADLEALKANIQVAQHGVDSLQHSLDNMVLRAPINGIVDQKNVEVGQYVTPGVPLAKVKNTSVIVAQFQITQDDVYRIKIGQKAQIRIIDDDSVYDGTVSYISATANATSRTFSCKVELPNKYNKLRPGIYAKVDISNGIKIPALVIPIKAVAGSEGSYYVFTDEHGVARKNDVVVGETYKDLIEVKSGLNEGESVICTNVNSLQDGDLISVAIDRGE